MAIDNGTTVLVITPDNRALHVGPAENTANHLMAGAGQPVRLEYYDDTGRPLRLRKDLDTWTFATDDRSSRVDGPVLLNRIDAALHHMQVVEDGQESQRTVPHPIGPLPAVLGELATGFDSLGGVQNQGNWLHQLAHAAGLAH